MPRKRLGELLVEANVLTPPALESALAEQKRTSAPLGRLLVEMGLVSEEIMVRALSHQLNIPAVQITDHPPADEALQMLELQFCIDHGCIPFGYQENGRFLDVALADPTNQDTFDEIRVKTRCNVRPYLAGHAAIDRAVRSAYGQAVTVQPEVEIAPASMTGEQPIDDDAVVIDMPPEEDQWDDESLSVFVPSGVDVHAGGDSLETVPLDFNDEPLPSTGHDGADEQLAALRDEVRELGQTLKTHQDELRILVERDELVLRRLLGLLVEKGVCSRDELAKRLATPAKSSEQT